MVSQVIQFFIPYIKKIKKVTTIDLLVVTQNLCDGKTTVDNDPKNPLREFCKSEINSDLLLDLLVRFGDYQKKNK